MKLEKVDILNKGFFDLKKLHWSVSSEGEPVKLGSQLNINPAAAARFWPDFGQISIFQDPLVAGRFS